MNIEIFLHARRDSIRAKIKIGLRRVLPICIVILSWAFSLTMDGSQIEVTDFSGCRLADGRATCSV
jgi:hypothetical protein